MTSTEFTVGLVEGSRISSKVLKPPGGGSSDIFGLGNSEVSYKHTSEKNQANEKCNTHNRLFGTSNPSVVENLESQPDNVLDNGNEALPKPTRKTYVHRNPITGEEVEICVEAKNDKDIEEKETVNTPSKPVVTSIRVRNPPGGKSSGIF